MPGARPRRPRRPEPARPGPAVFDLAPSSGSRATAVAQRLVVAEHGGRRAGFAVDEVTDVGELPPTARRPSRSFSRGAALDDGGLVGVVDVARLFATR